MTKYKRIEKSVCAPKGFKAAGMHCGLKKNKDKKDLALIYCDNVCNSACIYTTNKVKGSPIIVTRENLKNSKAQVVFCNSKNANTCNKDGVEKARLMCSLIAKELSIDPTDVIVASTGVIGQSLPIEPIENSCKELVSRLSFDGAVDACQAIMTTDTIEKMTAVEFELSDGTIAKIGALTKGSGMIHPNMATMLCFVTTDVKITPELLDKALRIANYNSFSMLSVDGDTSTNDMLSIMASGQAGNKEINTEEEDFKVFSEALTQVCKELVRLMAKDGEGATKLLVCKVKNAKDTETARTVAKTVVSSSLVKSAIFGEDANWGRILCAVGYSEATVDINKVDVDFSSKKGIISVCKDGFGVDFDEDIAKTVLSDDEIDILIDLKDKTGYAEAYGCDLTYDYVKINGDYRT